MRILCDACESAAATFFCAADEAALCCACDDKNIPAHIGRKFPRGVSGLVKLEVSDGRRWMVQGNFLGGRLRSLGNGWAEFARQTKLKVDDVCLFELITNDKEFSMKVSMYRNKPFTR